MLGTIAGIGTFGREAEIGKPIQVSGTGKLRKFDSQAGRHKAGCFLCRYRANNAMVPASIPAANVIDEAAKAAIQKQTKEVRHE
jgi:hypothetical protein